MLLSADVRSPLGWLLNIVTCFLFSFLYINLGEKLVKLYIKCEENDRKWIFHWDSLRFSLCFFSRKAMNYGLQSYKLWVKKYRFTGQNSGSYEKVCIQNQLEFVYEKFWSFGVRQKVSFLIEHFQVFFLWILEICLDFFLFFLLTLFAWNNPNLRYFQTHLDRLKRKLLCIKSLLR